MSPAEVRGWREAVGLTQQEAADRLGVALRTWQRWEDPDRDGAAARTPPPFLVRALRDVERELATRR